MKSFNAIVFVLVVTVSCIFTSCSKDEPEDPIFCTEEFRYITLEVEGDSLTFFYTIRMINNDTLFPENNAPIYDNRYVVLSDQYSSLLKNKSEAFQFVGLVNDSIVLKLDYTIAADNCHIFKVSGPAYHQL